jgi:hypothetical protein
MNDPSGKPEPGPMVALWLKIRESTQNPPEWGRKGTRTPGAPGTIDPPSQLGNATQAVLGAGEKEEANHE